MDPVSSSTVANASAADPGSAQGAASVSVLKKAMHLQSQAVSTLLEALPQPAPLATSGALGTQVDTYA